MNLGIAIKIVRKKMGISQLDLALMCDMSQTYLSQIETESKRPGSKTMKKICDAMQIPEGIIYVLAMEDIHIPEKRRRVYAMLFPMIRELALQMVSAEEVLEDEPAFY